jgi:hypothetical protein
VRFLTDEFIELVHPRDGHERILAMMAYLDESGIHRDAEACVAAGYFAKKGPWRQFERAWTDALAEAGVPLEEFHAKDLVSKTGFFHKWSEEKQDTLLSDLADAIAASEIHPVCCGIFVSDFANLSEKERKFFTGATWNTKKFLNSGCPSKPYFVVFTECLKAVAAHIRGGQKAHFFCGLDRPVSEYAREVFALYKSRPSSKHKLGTIAFPSASETPHLQAADLFSYLSYQHMLERKVDRDWSKPPSKLVLTLLQNRKAEADTLFRSQDVLRQMISHIPNLP